MAAQSSGIDGFQVVGLNNFVSGELGSVVISVILLHFVGYLVGYVPSLFLS